MRKSAIVAIPIFLFGCAAAVGMKHSSQPDDGNAETRAIHTTERAIAANRLTAIPLRCLSLSPAPLGTSGYLVAVREVHSADCGGDPDTEPRLFTIRVRSTDSRAFLQQPDGTERPLR